MKYALLLLLALACIGQLYAGNENSESEEEEESPEKRMAELVKWFKARIPIYRKAKFLLTKLGVSVGKLSDLHDGIDFYYSGYKSILGLGSDSPPYSVRIARINGTAIDMAPIENVVNRALTEKSVDNILRLRPEIIKAFKVIANK